jgi:hypothetical protein
MMTIASEPLDLEMLTVRAMRRNIFIDKKLQA